MGSPGWELGKGLLVKDMWAWEGAWLDASHTLRPRGAFRGTLSPMSQEQRSFPGRWAPGGLVQFVLLW